MQKLITFNDKYSLTKLVLDGVKQTTLRNELTPEEHTILSGYGYSDSVSVSLRDDRVLEVYDAKTSDLLLCKRCKYSLGELVAVAQSYRDAGYKTRPYDTPKDSRVRKWWWDIPEYTQCESRAMRDKRFVKAELMPRGVQIVGIDLRRIHDIDEEDYTKEGFIYMPELAVRYPYGCLNRYGAFTGLGSSAVSAFSKFIDKVYGKGVWDSNPFMVYYTFSI